MIEVPAAVTICGVLPSLASGATASAAGVTPKPARKVTLSLTISSWAMRLVLSGTAPSSLIISSTFLPATVSPCCDIKSLAAAASCLPVDCCWPVIGRMKPILTSCACATPTIVSTAAAAAKNDQHLIGVPPQDDRTAYQHPGHFLSSERNVSFCQRAMWCLSRPALSVRLALWIDDLFQPAEHVHAWQKLGEARVRLALLFDRGNELAIFELDPVHRNVDLGQVDLVVLAVGQVVVIGLVGAVVADIAEERSERPVIVERQ